MPGTYYAGVNLWEWTWDHYAPDAYATHAPLDPVGTSAGLTRAVRGGSYALSAEYQRVTRRFHVYPSMASERIGVRLVRSIPW